MKKLMLSVAALAVALIGFGTLSVSTTQANPSKIWVINDNVATGLTGQTSATLATSLSTAAGRTSLAALASFDSIQKATAGQIQQNATPGPVLNPASGHTYIIVQTDGSNTLVTLNGRGLTCNQIAPAATLNVCGTTPTGLAPDATDHMLVYQVMDTGTHLTNDTFAVTAVQDTISVDSATQKIVGNARDAQLSVILGKTTIQELSTGCGFTSSTSDPARAGTLLTYTDINGNALVGYAPTFSSSSASKMLVGTASGVGAATTPAPTATGPAAGGVVSMLLTDGTTIAGYDVICGVAAGTATLSAATSATVNEISGITGSVTRTQLITITGVPAKIALTAAPSTISCDGVNSGTVTAKVTDSAGNNVVDNTPVTFSVVALGTSNPIQTKTKDGSASSVVTPLSAATAGVTVTVSAGSVSASTRIDCALPIPTTVPAGGAASPTPRGGIGGPDTGNGGYLNQSNASGFPMWTLVALMLGSVTLVAGGLVTRRAGK